MGTELRAAVEYLGGGDIERGASAIMAATNLRGALDRSDGYRKVYGRRAAITKARGYACARAGGLADCWSAIAGASDAQLGELGIGLL